MKILIIDDDKFIRTVYTNKIEHEKFEVEVAADGEEGLHKAQSGKPDLILLDIILPVKDGFAVLQELKQDKNLKTIPVIVFSALSQESDIERVLKLGAVKYLPKDTYSVNQIIDEIKAVLSK